MKESHETWLCELWIQNTESDYFHYRNLYQELAEADKDTAVFKLSQAIQSDIEEGTPLNVGLYADLLASAISNIDFYAVAQGFAEEVQP